jgi:uncharacterized membrane protein
MEFILEQDKKAVVVAIDRKTPTMDRHYRSIIKAISWRVTGTLDTVIISFLITGHIRLALSIGFVELFTKVTLYYLHERFWNKVSFGRKPVAGDYEI